MIPNTVQISNRLTATVVHFFISLVVFVALIGTLLFFWYPSPYFSASGGWQGLRLVAALDLVLGPLMTLIIFNPQNSRRELAVVFLDSSFYTDPALAITSQGIDLDVLNPFGEEHPILVYAERPKEEGEDFARFATAIREERVPPHEQTWLYRSLSDNFSTVVRSTLDIEKIVTTNAAMSTELERLLERTPSELYENCCVALTTRYRNMVLVFDVAGYLLGSISAP